MITKYGFELNEDMVYLIETLKVEGYWSRKLFTLILQNKDIPLLNNIERIVKSLNINISKRLLLKIRLENNTKKEEIKLIYKDKELNFHIEKSPFDNNRVKAVTSLPYKKSYEIKLIYNKKEILIRIKVNKDGIISKSNLDCWIYGDLRFPKKAMLSFLDNYCGNKKEFHLEEFLLNSNEKLVMSAFSALVDCEGSLDYYGLYRRIRIRMRNYNYLKQWSELLKDNEIGCKLRKNNDKEFEINISGWEDFDRLNKLGFKLYHSKKKEKWKLIIKSFKRKQISRDSYREFYVNKLKELNNGITVGEFAKYTGKSKRTINHFFSKLERERLILRDKTHWPYLYFISTSSVR
jgi:hypothetical protein